MEIGIVSLYPNIKDIKYIVNAINMLGYSPYVLDLVRSTNRNIYNIIKKSNIKYWIFSGSPSMVIDRTSPQVPLEIYNLADKEFMLICYSMESVMYQMDIPISFRRQNKKEVIKLDINHINHYIVKYSYSYINVWRNHYGYISSIINKSPFIELASYQGESMILLYKNSILVQFHPERTVDGLILIYNWINHIKVTN